MGDKITMEFEPKDAAMIAAWQRQRENITAFQQQVEQTAERTKTAHKASESWLDGMKGGLAESTTKLTTFFTGFQVGKGVLDTILDGFEKWSEKLDELVEKQHEHRRTLEHELAAMGKLKESPAAEEAFKKMLGGTATEKLAAFHGVAGAAPRMDLKKQLALTDELQAASGAFGEDQLGALGSIAATIAKADPSKSAKQTVGLAIQQFAATDANKRGALSDETAVSAMQSLKAGGMSTERAMAFLSESANQGLNAKETQNIANKILGVDMQRRILHVGTLKEDRAFNSFVKETDFEKRRAMLFENKAVREAVLGERAEKFSHISRSALDRLEGTFTAKEGAGSSEAASDFLASDSLEARNRAALAGQAKTRAPEVERREEQNVEANEQADRWLNRNGPGGFSETALAAAQKASGWSKSLFGADVVKGLASAIDNKIDPDAAAKGVGLGSYYLGQDIPALGNATIPGVGAALGGAGAGLNETNALLRQIADRVGQPPQVAVQVNAPRFHDPGERAQQSPAAVLAH